MRTDKNYKLINKNKLLDYDKRERAFKRADKKSHIWRRQRKEIKEDLARLNILKALMQREKVYK